MRDYYPLLNSSHTLPEPDPAEEPAVPEPVVVDFVYNELEDRNGKTIALKVSFRLPLKS
jgi:hypothetical protein